MTHVDTMLSENYLLAMYLFMVYKRTYTFPIRLSFTPSVIQPE
jgi:hypothetical protein